MHIWINLFDRSFFAYTSSQDKDWSLILPTCEPANHWFMRFSSPGFRGGASEWLQEYYRELQVIFRIAVNIKRPLPKEAAVLFAVRSRLLNDRDRGVDVVLYGYAVRTAVGCG